MQGYEIVTIVDPQIADEDVPNTSDKINEFITSRGGAIARVQRWGRRRLAYPIKRQVEGHYLLTTFELEPEHSSELEADLVLAQEVLKHMVIKLDAEEFQRASEEPPTPVISEPPVETAEPAETGNEASGEAPAATQVETEEEPTPTPAEMETPTASTEESVSAEAPGADEAPSMEPEEASAPVEAGGTEDAAPVENVADEGEGEAEAEDKGGA